MDIGAFTDALIKALGGVFGVFGVSTETGQGLLKFVEFFGMIGEFIVKIFTSLSGLIGGA